MNTIEEYYEFAEHGIQDHFTVANTLFDVANKSAPEIALNLLIEAELLNTCTYRDEEFAFWTTVSRYKYERLGFSKIEDLIDAVVSYLKARLMIAKNPLLLAKYNHTLWHSTDKDRHVNGRLAIENYLAHISGCITKNCSDKDCGELINYLRSLDTLVLTLKHKSEDLITLLTQIVQKRNTLQPWFVFYSIEIIYLKRKLLPSTFNEDCLGALQECFQKEGLSSLKENIYSLALKYCQFLNKPVESWHDLMGHYYFDMASSRTKSKGDFLIPQYYAQAINYFKLSGNSEMHAQLSANFQKVKSENQLPSVPFSFPMPMDHSDYIFARQEAIKNHISQLNSDKLILFIGTSVNLIPSSNIPETKAPFLDYAQGSFLDKNNNFNHTKGGAIINSKLLELRLFIMDSLKDTFKHSIETNKLTADVFIKHLENESWIGKNEESKYWVTLLRPGIESFFSLYKKNGGEDPADFNSIVLTFDTLTIKVEGLLRTYAQLNNVNTTKIISEKGTGGKNVETREALMNELFSEEFPLFKALFEQKEYEFLKYLYLSGGMNIRNDLAHSFYKPENYSIEKLLLVVLSIFRISHGDIK